MYHLKNKNEICCCKNLKTRGEMFGFLWISLLSPACSHALVNNNPLVSEKAVPSHTGELSKAWRKLGCMRVR